MSTTSPDTSGTPLPGACVEPVTPRAAQRMVQWWKDGDHPEPGRVVKFAHPGADGTTAHMRCGHPWDQHGWLDMAPSSVEGHVYGITVCPGDLVTQTADGEWTAWDPRYLAQPSELKKQAAQLETQLAHVARLARLEGDRPAGILIEGDYGWSDAYGNVKTLSRLLRQHMDSAARWQGDYHQLLNAQVMVRRDVDSIRVDVDLDKARAAADDSIDRYELREWIRTLADALGSVLEQAATLEQKHQDQLVRSRREAFERALETERQRLLGPEPDSDAARVVGRPPGVLERFRLSLTHTADTVLFAAKPSAFDSLPDMAALRGATFEPAGGATLAEIVRTALGIYQKAQQAEEQERPGL